MHCSHFLKVALGSYKLHKVAPVPVVVLPKLSEVTGIQWQLQTWERKVPKWGLFTYTKSEYNQQPAKSDMTSQFHSNHGDYSNIFYKKYKICLDLKPEQ